jgi:tRNA-dihydrouridine synthase
MKQFLLTGQVPEIPVGEKMALLRRQIDESISRIDEYRGILHIRRHLAATPLFKGIRNFRETRIAMLRANTKAELTSILDHIENDILPTL